MQRFFNYNDFLPLCSSEQQCNKCEVMEICNRDSSKFTQVYDIVSFAEAIKANIFTVSYKLVWNWVVYLWLKVWWCYTFWIFYLIWKKIFNTWGQWAGYNWKKKKDEKRNLLFSLSDWKVFTNFQLKHFHY